MKDFINNLKSDFDIQLSSYSDSSLDINTYSVDKDGNIISLKLEEEHLKSLDGLLPLSDTVIELSLENCAINNIDQIKRFSKLRKLNLSGNPLSDRILANIKYLTDLEELELRRSNLCDTHVLCDLPNLKKLDVGGNDGLLQINGLENLSSLTHLKMSFNNIKSIESISLHENIQSLSMRASELQQISGLEKYINLKELNLGGSMIAKIQGLDHLEHLERLILTSTWINKIEGLDCLTNLKTLDLSNCDLAKIEGLNGLINLEKLNLSLNQIEKVENLDNLTNLQYVLLERCHIQDVNTSFLSKLKTSCLISLIGNPIVNFNEQDIPHNVQIQFRDSNSAPKRL